MQHNRSLARVVCGDVLKAESLRQIEVSLNCAQLPFATDRIPYVLVVGDDDVAHATVGVNPRGGDVRRDVALDQFIKQLAADVGEAVQN